jgi:TPP-dependent pyruvate/acetoin dehydrogenase alpha subunit
MQTITAGRVDVATLRKLHRELIRIRLTEERIAEVYPEQQMRCPIHLSIGQEAVSVGVCAHLAPTDYAMSGHRSHGHYLAKGGSLKAMFAEMYGKATGCTSGKGGSMHLLDLDVGFLGAVPIVGSTIPMAVGAAWGARMRGESRVVVTFFGEAATEEGVFHEAINFAALKQLPVIFVCENNLYSVYSPLSVRQPEGTEVAEVVAGHGVECTQGDGNDIVEVYTMAERAVTRARQGGGPAFLEFKTYRWREHCGPFYDNDIGYRTPAEFEDWKRRCPVERFETKLRADGVVLEEDLEAVRRSVAAEIDEAVAFARNSPFPDRSEMASFTYADDDRR